MYERVCRSHRKKLTRPLLFLAAMIAAILIATGSPVGRMKSSSQKFLSAVLNCCTIGCSAMPILFPENSTSMSPYAAASVNESRGFATPCSYSWLHEVFWQTNAPFTPVRCAYVPSHFGQWNRFSSCTAKTLFTELSRLLSMRPASGNR